jgi:hypothetical protein
MTSGIADDDELMRRVKDREDFLVWHADRDEWLPTLAGVRFDPDGMSTYSSGLLLGNGQSAADVVSGSSADLVYGCDVARTRALGFDAQHTPDADESGVGHAHCSITFDPGWAKQAQKAQRRALAKCMHLVHGASSLSPPDGA